MFCLFVCFQMRHHATLCTPPPWRRYSTLWWRLWGSHHVASWLAKPRQSLRRCGSQMCLSPYSPSMWKKACCCRGPAECGNSVQSADPEKWRGAAQRWRLPFAQGWGKGWAESPQRQTTCCCGDALPSLPSQCTASVACSHHVEPQSQQVSCQKHFNTIKFIYFFYIEIAKHYENMVGVEFWRRI